MAHWEVYCSAKGATEEPLDSDETGNEGKDYAVCETKAWWNLPSPRYIYRYLLIINLSKMVYMKWVSNQIFQRSSEIRDQFVRCPLKNFVWSIRGLKTILLRLHQLPPQTNNEIYCLLTVSFYSNKMHLQYFKKTPGWFRLPISCAKCFDDSCLNNWLAFLMSNDQKV